MASERGVLGMFVGVGAALGVAATIAGETTVEMRTAGAGSVGGNAVAVGCAGASVGGAGASLVATDADGSAMRGCAHAASSTQPAASNRQLASITESRSGLVWMSTPAADLHSQIQPTLILPA